MTAETVSTAPQLCFVTCPGASLADTSTHRMAYWAWGNPASEQVVVCVHGLSRQGRDFDTLAKALSHQAYVVCPDVVGRGQSDWLADAKGYQVFTYASDMVQLMQQLKAQRKTEGPLTIDWVGTSMGGLIGLTLSSLPQAVTGISLRKMVVNDVGPRLNHEALVRIGEYLGKPMNFATEQDAADYLWSISTSFGPHTPEQWLALSRPMLKPASQGDGWVLHYDPSIAAAFRALTPEAASSGEAMLWQIYDQLTCELLIVRGSESDLLTADTAQAMCQRNPKARLFEVAGVGHAPTLMADDQVKALKDFLTA
jgi:pimeloyl-ACP methyl ester carboxylesterase